MKITPYIRSRISIALPLATFVFAYFFTTVLGNILYTLPIGQDFPKRSMPDFSWSQFHTPFDFRFWLLVLSPLIITPIVSFLVAKVARPFAKRATSYIPEFSVGFFAAANLVCLAYIGFKLYQTEALSKLLAGRDPLDAVRFRFALQDDLGLLPSFVLMSLLQFLSTYAVVRAIRSKDVFWISAASTNIILVSAFFVLLNMKWPIILFEITIAAATFVSVRKHYILASGFIFLVSVLTYFAISVALLRIHTTDEFIAEQRASIEQEYSRPNQPFGRNRNLPSVNHNDFSAALPPKTILTNLFVVAINRLAMIVPFYYDTYTTYGAVCGSFLDRVVLRKPGSCHPSIYIYSKMFPDDGFNGRGTAPAAHQIYEYARSGWIGAIVALLIGSTIIGLYTAFYFARQNSVFAAAFIMGIPAAYLLSQLPVEAMIFSEVGALWWLLLVPLNAGILWILKARQHRFA